MIGLGWGGSPTVDLVRRSCCLGAGHRDGIHFSHRRIFDRWSVSVNVSVSKNQISFPSSLGLLKVHVC